MTRVKICGLTRTDDVEFAVDCGADAVGFVLEPSSPRYVANFEKLRDLARAAGPYAATVAVFGAEARPMARSLELNAIQAGDFGDEQFPGLRRIRVVRLGSPTSLSWQDSIEATDSALLLDAYDPIAFGGTGQHCDWNQAAEVVNECSRAVILAGGLAADNVCKAIATVRPYAVDVSSGVESAPGMKDRSKVRDFIQAVRSAS